ncbi:MAG: tyrosine-type recombinase/integrase [Caulobacter sp.]|nr:tyrosine-type recombinase/integrase [Caulobacter sp.]
MTKRLANGRVAIYWYRYRGGPLLLRFDGESLGAAHRAEAQGASQLVAAFASSADAARSPAVLRDVVTCYRASPEYDRLAHSTKAQWSRWLDEIVVEFGDFPLRFMAAVGVRKRFKAWRNRRADKPRTADYGMQVLRRLLSFALDEEMITVNPVADLKGIYRANRADQVVEPEELAKILGNTTREAALAIRLAAETGMRRGDLIALKWEHVLENRIEFVTGKSGGRTHVIVPLTDAAQGVIADLRARRDEFIRSGRVPHATVLLTQKGTAWRPNSLTQAFDRARTPFGITKRLHDLRGTAATNWVRAGFSHQETARFVGWEVSQVDNIIRRYVDADIIARAAISRLERERNAS